MSVFPKELELARDSVLFSDVGTGPFLNTTYGNYSPAFPNPLIAFPEIIGTTLGHINESLPWNGLGQWLTETWEQHYIDSYLSLTNIAHFVLMAVFMTVVRHIATEALLKKIPVWFKCKKSEGDKFPEAAFRTVVYTIGWSWTTYIMFHHGFFYFPKLTMIYYIPGVSLPYDVYWLYVFEIGLYLHSIYATLFVELVRRDFAAQLIHHIVTLGLLVYSFSIRLYGFGVLVLFMHDLGDAKMEFAKCCLYFKTRNKKDYMLPELLANVLFGTFVLNWILFRLYWLPVKAMYASGHVSKNFLRPAPHYLFPNILLWILYVLHWYWFYFIAKLVVHVLSGKEVNDNRDFEDDDADVIKKEKKEE